MDLEQDLPASNGESSSSDNPDASLDGVDDSVMLNDKENSTLLTVDVEPVSPNYLEPSLEDNIEGEKINEMYGPDAGPCCTSNCNYRIPIELALEYRQTFLEYSTAERDLVCLSHLEAHKEHSSMQATYEELYARRCGKKKIVKKSRCNVSYYFRGIPICKSMYFFIHPMGKTRYENIQKHFNSFGITPRVHGLRGKPVSRSTRNFGLELKRRVVDFIKEFAEKYAVPLPGRIPGSKNFDVLKLPPEMNKTFVHNEYLVRYCSDNDEFRVGNRSFRNLWNTFCPYITTMKPATDSHERCRKNSEREVLQNCLKSECMPKKASRKRCTRPDNHGEAEQDVEGPDAVWEPKTKAKRPRKVTAEPTPELTKTMDTLPFGGET